VQVQSLQCMAMSNYPSVRIGVYPRNARLTERLHSRIQPQWGLYEIFLFGVFSLDWRVYTPNGGLGKSLLTVSFDCREREGLMTCPA
jgi:hypothetical protein